jgi:hypothetical protein
MFLTLTGKLILASGQPRANGTILFVPPRARLLSEFGESSVIITSPVSVKTDANGLFSVTLRAATGPSDGYTVIFPDGREVTGMLLTQDMTMGSLTVDFNIFMTANGKSTF